MNSLSEQQFLPKGWNIHCIETVLFSAVKWTPGKVANFVSTICDEWEFTYGMRENFENSLDAMCTKWIIWMRVVSFLSQFGLEDATNWNKSKQGILSKGILDPSYFRDSVDESSLVIVNSLSLRKFLDNRCVNLRMIWMQVRALWGCCWIWLWDTTIYRGWTGLPPYSFLQWCALLGW